ncbi:MAG: MFS transporter [Prevotella sp.]|nr:MFS transporter [Prevotella sp.]
MDTQNTPIHIRLWNRDFWLLAVANLLVSMAIYMQVILIPTLADTTGLVSLGSVSAMMGGYGVGLYLLGCFCSYFVQRHRRHHVCIGSILLMAMCLVLPYYLHQWIESRFLVGTLLLTRLVTGALFGLIQMILSSTLVVDCSESSQRTEANYAEAWFGRFAIALGPLSALLTLRLADREWAVWISAGLAVASALLIMMVRFPFRAPDDNVRLFSTDRFILPSGWLLFLNLLIVTTVLGICLPYAGHSQMCYACLMLGFLLALLAEKFIFVNAELKSETVAGLILMGAAVLVFGQRQSATAYNFAFTMLGLGSGLIGSRFLLFFIKLSLHCQRGTSQSTFFLAWESGVALGLTIYFASANRNKMLHLIDTLPQQTLFLVVLALLLYLLCTHQWYLKHKNR